MVWCGAVLEGTLFTAAPLKCVLELTPWWTGQKKNFKKPEEMKKLCQSETGLFCLQDFSLQTSANVVELLSVFWIKAQPFSLITFMSCLCSCCSYFTWDIKTRKGSGSCPRQCLFVCFFLMLLFCATRHAHDFYVTLDQRSSWVCVGITDKKQTLTSKIALAILKF